MKILGRSPLMWTAFIQALLAFLVTLPVVGLSRAAAAATVTVLSALLIVWESATARPLVIPALVGSIRTLIIGFAGFGLVLPEDTLAALVSALSIGLALLTQPNTTPAIDPAPGFITRN